MYPKYLNLITLIAAASLAACSSTPERMEVLEDARTTVAEVEGHPNAQQWAGDELEDARDALQNAEYLRSNNGDYDDIYHQAYLALRHAEIARERISEGETRDMIERSEAERSQVLLMAREAEAKQAMQLAEVHERQAEAAIEERRRLQILMQVLEAKKTERGYVLTLGDILFDTDKAFLKPGAASTLDQLAAFLNDYPDRRLLIEGHADSRGTDGYNISLSASRANAVKLALIERGIDPGRLEVKALGEHYPVATNDTDAGMQRNRRVEVVVSDDEGSFPAAAIRTVSNY